MTYKRKEVIGGCTLLLGDCESIMPTIGQFDLVLTDPPYGIDENDKKIASRGKLAAPKDYGVVDWDKKPASPEAIALIREISQHQIIFGGNYFELPPSSCWLVWDKQNGSNDFADCELAWTNLKKAVRRVHWRWNGMIRKGDDVRIHPTQKPLGVMEWCLTHVPNVTAVLDPYLGSGTCAVACIKAGIEFTGIEKNEQYFYAACDRIRKAYDQPDFFVSPPEKPKPIEQIDLLTGDTAA